MRFYPGGVAEISPNDVISSDSVEAYEVLPNQAGLAQLVARGDLTTLEEGYYAIEKLIPSFPIGLAGGHSVRFLLRTGVPMPDGNPIHSAVFSETTGECLSYRCR